MSMRSESIYTESFARSVEDRADVEEANRLKNFMVGQDPLQEGSSFDDDRVSELGSELGAHNMPKRLQSSVQAFGSLVGAKK
jgi:hypothetical protein